jgi:hypothetical protein
MEIHRPRHKMVFSLEILLYFSMEKVDSVYGPWTPLGVGHREPEVKATTELVGVSHAVGSDHGSLSWVLWEREKGSTVSALTEERETTEGRLVDAARVWGDNGGEESREQVWEDEERVRAGGGGAGAVWRKRGARCAFYRADKGERKH